MMASACFCTLRTTSRSTWSSITKDASNTSQTTIRIKIKRSILYSDRKFALTTKRIHPPANTGTCIKNAHLLTAKKRRIFILKNIMNEFSSVVKSDAHDGFQKYY